jgi:hypothetical protein
VKTGTALLALGLLLASAAAHGMELVVFQSERSLVVERVEREEGLLVLVLPGGGKMGVPEGAVLRRFEGYVPPPEEAEPEKPLPPSLPYREIIARACQESQVDWKLVAALIRVESNFDPRAVSPKGAQGLMQLMPSTQADMGVKDPFSPEENIRGGVRYLRWLLDTFQGDLELTLAAYNAGIRRVQQVQAVPPIPETQRYVARILALYPTL